MILMMPCLTTWADFMGVLGGGIFGVITAGFTWGTYFHATLDALVIRDIMTGLMKSVMFGLVITAVGCQEGFSTGLGLGAGRALDHLRRGEIDFPGGHGRSDFHHYFLLYRAALEQCHTTAPSPIPRP